MHVKNIRIASQSAEILGSIDDLLIQIFCRLRIKSLIRLQLVSKQWRALIKNSEFLRILNSKQDSTPLGIFYLSTSADPAPVNYMPFSTANSSENITPDWAGLRVVQSCNGLLLGVGTIDKSCSGDWSHYSRLFVCNPTTRQVLILPQIEYVGNGPNNVFRTQSNMILCFDPIKSPYYKIFSVVRIINKLEVHFTHEVQIYSSETGLWALAVDSRLTKHHRLDPRDEAVYWNGAVHWIRSGIPSLYYDIEDGVFNTFPSPPDTFVDSRYTCYDIEDGVFNTLKWAYCFGEFCNHMHFIKLRETKINIYELERDRSAWFVKYLVDLSPLLPRYPISCTPSSIVHGAEEKDSFFVFALEHEFVRCNLVSNTFEKLPELEVEVYTRSKTFQYIESLCPV